jgi:FdhE protein
LEVNRSILKRLEEWQQEEGSLPEILGYYRGLLRVQLEVGAEAASPESSLTKTEIDSAIRKGIPLLEWNALSIDWTAFERLFRAAAAVILEHSESSGAGLEGIASDGSVLREIAKTWYEGSALKPVAEARGVNEESLAVATHCAMKPFLVSQAQALIPLVPQEQWRRAICPICGGKPDFAYLDKERGARWLVCARCDTEWLFQRLECPYCGNKDQEKLKYYADDAALYRLYVCLQCMTYLKAIDLRKTEADVLMPLERVLTVDMDRQGGEEGYSAGWAAASSTSSQ